MNEDLKPGDHVLLTHRLVRDAKDGIQTEIPPFTQGVVINTDRGLSIAWIYDVLGTRISRVSEHVEKLEKVEINLPHSQELAHALRRLLLHSWSAIDFKYASLTAEEKECLTEEQFVELVRYARPRVGLRVRAACQITKGGDGVVGNPEAEAGEWGTIVHVTEDGLPTVNFDRTGTATLVGLAEVLWW